MHEIKPGGTWSEPYRVTCPYPDVVTVHCTAEDKLAGQGVALKFTKREVLAEGSILQVEYALVMDPNRGPPPGDPFHRIRYDVSLLDCGPEYNVSDFNATQTQHEERSATAPDTKRAYP
ncbi:hypothetical protein K458DRAFT_467651 [Lentithecium fluviatile CBS 122367]|uniref:Uncharacterized protein n=1 Tax=Lentithecium fluviatile CBS 122367 TaxID=1168545 RepID=A0A6G1JBU3_9PLEO|nr:hypothetical protein K458DRAFT_467651 [Lentithecium fluviatile CBS 122367]